MKLQHLAIIFIIIIIPIILVFSYYLELESSTIQTQTSYDEKLLEATSEAMEAYEINTVDWATNYDSLFNLKRRNITRSVEVFIKSLSNKLGVAGTSKENILVYIPAIVYTMYDGYYIYSPTYVPKTINYKSDSGSNENDGKQVFYYPDAQEGFKFSTSATQDINTSSGSIRVAGQPMFVYREDLYTDPETGTYKGESFTVNIEDAEMEFKHVLKTFVPYSITYSNEYTINYTLDNYIRVYGKEEAREGYIINESASTYTTTIESGLNSISIGDITPENLTENVPIKEGSDIVIKNYSYIYNSSNDKLYYDPEANKFFDIVGNYQKEYLQPADVNSNQAKYKKLLIRESLNDTTYVELYQLLNKNEGNKWYTKDGTGKLVEYTKKTIKLSREYDCSAVNYWAECYCFNKWLDEKGFDRDDIIEKRQKAIIDNINNNLSLSISSYSKNSRTDFTIPKLSDEDWEQALSNISLITFFQGIKIGLRTYNNYAIVSSSDNNEYINEDSIYFTDTNNEYYHRYSCEKVNESHGTVQGYRNTEFKVQSYEDSDSTKYYYKHNGFNDSGKLYGNQECFYCIVNRNILKAQNCPWWKKIKDISIARERYIQFSRTRLTETNVKLTGTGETDIDSATFNGQFTKFYGTSVSAEKARSFIETVLQSNVLYPSHQVSVYVYVLNATQVGRVFPNEIGDINYILSNINLGNTYTINTDQTIDGYITRVYFEEN